MWFTWSSGEKAASDGGREVCFYERKEHRSLSRGEDGYWLVIGQQVCAAHQSAVKIHPLPVTIATCKNIAVKASYLL